MTIETIQDTNEANGQHILGFTIQILQEIILEQGKEEPDKLKIDLLKQILGLTDEQQKLSTTIDELCGQICGVSS